MKDKWVEQYVAYLSDANSATSLIMMLASLICGALFEVYAYLPMIAGLIMQTVPWNMSMGFTELLLFY